MCSCCGYVEDLVSATSTGVLEVQSDCVKVRRHAGTHARTHAHTHTRTRTHAHTHTRTHAHTHTRTHAHTHTRTHARTNARSTTAHMRDNEIHTHARTHAHAHAHTHTHTHTHTHGIRRWEGWRGRVGWGGDPTGCYVNQSK